MQASEALDFLFSMSRGSWSAVAIAPQNPTSPACAAATFANPQGDAIGYGYLLLVGGRLLDVAGDPSIFHLHYRLTHSRPQRPRWNGSELLFEPTDARILSMVIGNPTGSLTEAQIALAREAVGWPEP